MLMGTLHLIVVEERKWEKINIRWLNFQKVITLFRTLL